jgi:hypothetical protein
MTHDPTTARTQSPRLAAPLLAVLGVAAVAGSGSALAQDAYDGPVTEIALRVVTAPLADFEAARDAFVGALTEQPGVGTDREFVAVLDGRSFTPPEAPVYVGMTQYDDAAAFAAASAALGAGELAGTFFGTFTPVVFTALRPLDPADAYDLAALAPAPGQVLEIAVRDLSRYEAFDLADYDAKRLAFLEVLAGMPGVVAEYQWASVLEPGLVVGMTVYENLEAVQTLSGDPELLAVAMPFLERYPTITGYLVVDAR